MIIFYILFGFLCGICGYIFLGSGSEDWSVNANDSIPMVESKPEKPKTTKPKTTKKVKENPEIDKPKTTKPKVTKPKTTKSKAKKEEK